MKKFQSLYQVRLKFSYHYCKNIIKLFYALNYSKINKKFKYEIVFKNSATFIL